MSRIKFFPGFIPCKTLLIIIFSFSLNILFSQNELRLQDGLYYTYEDFLKKSPSKKIEAPLKIKNRLGSASYTLRDEFGKKITEYFAVVQNDSILLSAKAVEKKLSSNKKVIFKNKKTDYFLSLGSNLEELYFRQYNNSKSSKYIGFGTATPTSIVFSYKFSKFYIFIERLELVSYLNENNRTDLIQLLSKKRKLNFREAINVMENFLELKKRMANIIYVIIAAK